MDWQGQKLAEELMQITLVISAIVAFIAGYVTSSFELMMVIYAGGLVFTILLAVPNWPFYNRQALKWLAPDAAASAITPAKTVVNSKKSKASRK